MRDWTISTTQQEPVSAHALAATTCPGLLNGSSEQSTLVIRGSYAAGVAAVAEAALNAGRTIVPPSGASDADTLLPSGTLLSIDTRIHAAPFAGGVVRTGWDLALFTSGSTGTPRGHGFTTAQLDLVTGWYESLYQVSADSVIVTSLPPGYNFTFIAGILLAARAGARLHLSSRPHRVLSEAAEAARRADRVIVLANPVVLDQASPAWVSHRSITIDSGGASLSRSAVSRYRDHGHDVREGYGLTETASLTHWDSDADERSLGTVGSAMPGVEASVSTTGKPIVHISGPATGVPLDPAEPVPGPVLATSDLGVLDDDGRLRLLGRTDDHPIGGLWPRDTLDLLGPLLGRRCALVRHPAPDRVSIRLLRPLPHATAVQVTALAANALGLSPESVTVTHQTRQLLHSVKLRRD